MCEECSQMHRIRNVQTSVGTVSLSLKQIQQHLGVSREEAARLHSLQQRMLNA